MKIEKITLVGFEPAISLYGRLRGEYLANTILAAPSPKESWGLSDEIFAKVKELGSDVRGFPVAIEKYVYDILANASIHMIVSDVTILEAMVIRRFSDGNYSEINTFMDTGESFPYHERLNNAIGRLVSFSDRMTSDSDIEVKPEALLLPAKCLSKKLAVSFSGMNVEWVAGELGNSRDITVFNKLFLNTLVGSTDTTDVEAIIAQNFAKGVYGLFDSIFRPESEHATKYFWENFYQPVDGNSEKVNLMRVSCGFGDLNFASPETFDAKLESLQKCREELCGGDDAVLVKESLVDSARILFSCTTTLYEFLELYNHLPMKCFAHIYNFGNLKDSTEFMLDPSMESHSMRLGDRLKRYFETAHNFAPNSPDKYNLILLNTKVRFLMRFGITDIVEAGVLNPMLATIRNGGFSGTESKNYLSVELEAFLTTIESITKDVAKFVFDFE